MNRDLEALFNQLAPLKLVELQDDEIICIVNDLIAHHQGMVQVKDRYEALSYLNGYVLGMRERKKATEDGGEEKKPTVN